MTFVRTHVADGLGWITLDRSRALNALDLSMVTTIGERLDEWSRLPGLRAVVIRSSDDRAFCAGGDIRAVREQSLAGDHAANRAFFTQEYAVNRRIAELPLPFVALIDGVCMGGGLGLSVHGSIRVVTERASLAMPETGIGFLPDIGATWFLPRLPGATGMFLGLTGHVADAADALHCGLATHFVPSHQLPGLLTGLADRSTPVEETVARAAAPVGAAGAIALHGETIDECFGAPTLDEVLERLAGHADPWAVATGTELRRRSPWSAYVTFALLRAPVATLPEALTRELLVAMALTRTDDFLEGVRSVLVDRDRNPAWTSRWGADTAREIDGWLTAVLADPRPAAG